MQEANLAFVQKQACLTDRTVTLTGTAVLTFGQTIRKALIIKPYAQHIPLETPFQLLQHYVRQYVDTVERPYKAGYLHRDLSYYNLLITGNRAIISDWQTMSRVEVSISAWHPGHPREHLLYAVSL